MTYRRLPDGEGTGLLVTTVAREMLMVQQRRHTAAPHVTVSATYAWNVQDDEVRAEMLAQTQAALATIASRSASAEANDLLPVAKSIIAAAAGQDATNLRLDSDYLWDIQTEDAQAEALEQAGVAFRLSATTADPVGPLCVANHADRCCRACKTHTNPHRGCILR